MSLLSPTYRVTIGGQRIDMTSEPLASTLVRIEVRRDMAPLIDRFDLTVARVGALAPERGDEAEIQLGFAGAVQTPQTVMTGTVDEIDAGPERVRIAGFGAGSILSRSRGNLVFRDKTAAQIITEMADTVGTSVARTATSEVLPYYVADARRSRYFHMTELARLTGFDLYLDTEDALIFEPFGNGRRAFPLDNTEDILNYHVERTEPHAEQIQAWGESPGASAGAESWSWLAKDFEPQHGQAGSGEPLQLLEHSALRTAEAAQRAADALMTRIMNRRIRGRLTVLGNPAIQLGDTIQLSSMPDDDLNTTFQVRGVHHRVDKAAGYTTQITFRALGGAS